MRISRRGASLDVECPAKLNLTLRVLGRRPDGFHDLETLMLSVRLTDTLQFSPLENNVIQLTCRMVHASPSGPVPVDERNLIVRAARKLQQRSGTSAGARIHLTKRIPMEAGLGGGSANAAAALLALNRLWNLGLDSVTLHALAAELGSDVNFFIDQNVAAVCRGRGEIIEPVSMPQRWHAVIIKPPSGLSTADVFTGLKLQPGQTTTSPRKVADVQVPSRIAHSSHHVTNDLTSVARRLNPQVDQILLRLEKLNLHAIGMTGSGSACFGLCRSARHARLTASRCRQWRHGRVFIVNSGV